MARRNCRYCSGENCNHVAPPPIHFPAMTDKEASRVVLPSLGTRMTGIIPESWKALDSRIQGDAAARYTGGCCTVEAPCDKHRAALLGRDWRTGEIG